MDGFLVLSIAAGAALIGFLAGHFMGWNARIVHEKEQRALGRWGRLMRP